MRSSLLGVRNAALDLYINALTGNDAFDGLTEARAVQTWARLEELFPSAYRTAFRIHLLGTTPIVVPDGEHTFPRQLGTALPVQDIGSFAQVGGTRTIAGGGVGTNTITDTVGAWTVNGFALDGVFTVRFTSGTAIGTRYSVQRNDADTLWLAHAFENGPTPSPGDTYVLENAAVALNFNDVQWRAFGAVIFHQVYLYGTGAGSVRCPGFAGTHVLQFTGGPFYMPNCMLYTTSGRTWVVDAALRSYDLNEEPANEEGGGYVNPYPDLIDGYYGFGMFTGDLVIGTHGDVKGCLLARFIDMCNEDGGNLHVVNGDIYGVSQLDTQAGAYFRMSTSPGNSSFVGTSTGQFRFFRGGRGFLTDVDMTASARGIFATSGGDVVLRRVVGVVAAGPGVLLSFGGALRDDEGGNTITGPGGVGAGDVVVDGSDVTWAQVDAWGSLSSGHVGP